MKPEDFQLSILEDAYRLRRHAMQRSQTHELDPRTSMWVIRDTGWRELMMACGYLNYIVCEPGPKSTRRELLGLPVRVTIDDDPDVPMIQLVMEPMMVPR